MVREKLRLPRSQAQSVKDSGQEKQGPSKVNLNTSRSISTRSGISIDVENFKRDASNTAPVPRALPPTARFRGQTLNKPPAAALDAATDANRKNGKYGVVRPISQSTSFNAASSTMTKPVDGEPIRLPDNLESIPKAENFPPQRHRWNTNEEIAALLISFDKHSDWLSKEVKIRPKSGSMLLYSRKKVRYRRDGYCWKKRKDGKTTREDHMKLKVQGIECIYGCYVHSAILPTFHRRCYWLLQNPDIVLVHYLNVPYPDDNKLIMASSISLWADKKEWTKEELISQLKPMFFSEEEPDINNELEISTAETVEAIVTQLMEKQRVARAAAAKGVMECACGAGLGSDHAKNCSQHPLRRLTIAKLPHQNQQQHVPILSQQHNQHGQSAHIIHSIPQLHQNHAQDPSIALTSSRHSFVAHSSSSDSIVNQGGGGLLILNSNNHSAGSANTHGHHQISAPFTLASYFSPNHGISTSHNGRGNHLTLHHNPQNVPHPLPQHHVHVTQHVQTQEPLVKREMKDDSVENLRLDLTNGNIGLDTGTFANLVSSLENTESYAKEQPKVHKQSLCIKSEILDNDHIKDEMYSQTLSLSQEDIQKALSANLPTNSNKSPNSVDENPMDFIDNNMANAEDDVLANLDAFDMLSDFPDLDHYDPSPSENPNSNNSSASSSTNVSGASVTNQSQPTSRCDFKDNSSTISDYSPEWAYPEGGVKVLVTGPWYSSVSPYTVLFDSVPTATTLVQSGVLRCYCPSHEAGLVTLQVACNGFVISNSVIFEYKNAPVENSIKEEETLQEEDEHLLKFTLLQRLGAIESQVGGQSEAGSQERRDAFDRDVMMHRKPDFQERVVSHCEELSRISGSPLSGSADASAPVALTSSLKGQTVLHLSARLGYAKLIVCLLRWKEESRYAALQSEVDVSHKDERGRTALSWACAGGHLETARILLKNNPLILKFTDKEGATPHALALENGHEELAEELKQAEEEFSEKQMLAQRAKSVFSPLSVSVQREIDPDIFLKPTARGYEVKKSKQIDSSSDDLDRGILGAGSSLNVSPLTPQKTTLLRVARVTRRPPTGGSLSRNGTPECAKQASLDSGLDVLQNKQHKFGCTPVNDPSTGLLQISLFSDENSDPSVPPSGCVHNNKDVMNDSVKDGGQDAAGIESASADDSRVFTLAEQIIAAIPERIKGDEEDVTDLLSPCGAEPPSVDLNMDVILQESPDANSEFNFELSDIMSYRYIDVRTPSSSMSPASSSCLPSPVSFSLDPSSPTPTTADFSEFFQASNRDFSKDFSNLALSDQEQKELYEAAKIIQKAFRLYKGRKRQQTEKEKEMQAAVLIQNYYRRYKQYAYFRQMSRAATLIQTQFRSYRENKRFKKSLEAGPAKYNLRGSREGTPVQPLKRTSSQRRQHQAARKIQQFMRQTKQKLQRERAVAAESETDRACHRGQTAEALRKPGRARPLSGPPTPPMWPAARSSEPCRRDTDPLLSTASRPPLRPEQDGVDS